jgi:hypothetical protein
MGCASAEIDARNRYTDCEHRQNQAAVRTRFRRGRSARFGISRLKKTAARPNKLLVCVFNGVARDKLGRASRKVCSARKTGEIFEV